VIRLRETIIDLAITLGWAILFASIMLQYLYLPKYSLVATILLAPPLENVILLFSTSLLAGMLLIDPLKVVSAFIIAFATALLIMFTALLSPVLLGTATGSYAGNAISTGAIGFIFGSVFPTATFTTLLGGFAGGILGEMLHFDVKGQKIEATK
jgi:hypothetical protein